MFDSICWLEQLGRCMFIQHEIDCAKIDDFLVLPCGPYSHEDWLRHEILFKLTH